VIAQSSVSANALKLFLIAGAALSLSACDSKNDQPSQDSTKAYETAPMFETPYSVWPSKRMLTAEELGDQLKADVNTANKICEQDANQPERYSQHFALVSTQSWDRIDLAEKYNLDTSKPVAFGGSGKILAPNLGDFLAQQNKVDPDNKAGRDMIKLTFSHFGKFTGYCDETQGYTKVINVASSDGQLTEFVTRCDQQAVVVCMSVR